MIRITLFISLLCLSLWGKGQSRSQPIVLGHIDTLYSETLQEKRPIWIYSPSFDTSYFSKPQYPVLYVLDGDGYFVSLVTMIQQLSVINGNTVLPEMIIVGIPNLPGKRTKDLTPTNSSFDKTSGGGENFTAFLEKELIPYVDKNYATAPHRTLVGHSLGGLMVINTLLKHTTIFNGYVALDPSMFYDKDLMLKQTATLLQQKKFKGSTLFLGIANTMNPGMDTLQVRTDTTELTHHIRSILKLKDNLQAHWSNGLRWGYKFYPDDDHASVALIAAYDALRFIFHHNRFPRNQPQNQYYDKTYSAAELRKLIKQHYQLVSQEMGYQLRPAEATLNQFGYIYLQQQDYERAQMFFQVNIDYYPNSFNVYDSMGDYYLALHNKKKAIELFKKALTLKKSPEIEAKLEKLRREK